MRAFKAQGKVPKGFKQSLIHPLFKKGDKKVFDCYRTISLRPTVSNYLLRTYLKVCNFITRLTVLPFQMNRPKHNCADNIFILTRLIDLCRSSKVPLFFLFTDLKKAFDSVARDFLFQVLQNRCPKKFFSVLQDLYTNTELVFEDILVLAESGVLQGDTLAAVLFVWLIDEIMREWERRKNPKWGIKIIFRKGKIVKEFFPHEWTHLSDVEIKDLIVNWLAFADDVVFVSHDLDEILTAFRLFRDLCKMAGLEINAAKCGLMSMIWNAVSLSHSIKVDKELLPVVSEYTYLGVQITNTGDFSTHVEIRSTKSLGVVASRMKNAKSWIGKDTSLLLTQLNVCFAPCLTWGTNVLTLRNQDLGVLDVTFFRFLRKIFRVRFDRTSKRYEKNKKQLLELSKLCPPSQTLPFARLKYFFHLLDADTVFPPECFLNGKVQGPNGVLEHDKRAKTYAKQIQADFTNFNISEIPISILSKKPFQKNILKECIQFGNSIFASLAERGTLVSSKTPDFPPPHQFNNFVIATDGSLSKPPKKGDPVTGGYAVVDSFGNFYSSDAPCTEQTSSTTLELQAIKKAFFLLQLAPLPECQVIFLVDSLSALRLILGLDERAEDLHLLREIDKERLALNNIQEVFIHVRSHRNTPVALNNKADKIAGKHSNSNFFERTKCEKSCSSIVKCEACSWNDKVNKHLASFLPTPTPTNLFASAKK